MFIFLPRLMRVSSSSKKEAVRATKQPPKFECGGILLARILVSVSFWPRLTWMSVLLRSRAFYVYFSGLSSTSWLLGLCVHWAMHPEAMLKHYVGWRAAAALLQHSCSLVLLHVRSTYVPHAAEASHLYHGQCAERSLGSIKMIAKGLFLPIRLTGIVRREEALHYNSYKDAVWFVLLGNWLSWQKE